MFDPAAGPSFWHDRNPAPRRAPLDGDTGADVVVVGAGMTGLAAAGALARQGLSVIVLEAACVAGAATGRNVGFVMEGVAESYERTVALWGRARAQRARRFTVANHELLAERIESGGIECGYCRRGCLHLAASDIEEGELREGAGFLADDGFAAELVAADALPAWARRKYQLGLVVPGDGELDPVAFAQGLARLAEADGVGVHEDTEVTAVVDDAGGVTVQTPHGSVRAEAAVIATNAYGDRFEAWQRGRIDATRGQVLATAPLPPLFDRPIYASHGYEYWRQLPTGEVVLGGWRNLDAEGEVGHDNTPHPAIQAAMESFLRGLDPALADLVVTHRWAGIMGFSRDSLPAIGPLPGRPRVSLAAGFTGHGFGFAVHAGEVVAALLATGTHQWADLFAPRRFA